MAGTVVITEETYGTVKKIKFAWTADGSGDVSGTDTVNAFCGDILLLATVPGTGTAPTDDYDVVINDEDSVDVLAGAGADRDQTDTEWVQGTSLGMVCNDKLSLVIENAGAGGEGTVYLYIR